MQQLRLFLAIDLPDDIAQTLGTIQDRLVGKVPARSVRWVKSQNIHLTLRFLGDTVASKVAQISAALDDVAAGQPSFELMLGKLGCFPNPRRPRTIWLGLEGDLTALNSLYGRLQAALDPLGWQPEERPFRAHLTPGRVKDYRQKVQLPWGDSPADGAIQVTDLRLIESQLTRSGPIYTVRHRAILRL